MWETFPAIIWAITVIFNQRSYCQNLYRITSAILYLILIILVESKYKVFWAWIILLMPIIINSILIAIFKHLRMKRTHNSLT